METVLGKGHPDRLTSMYNLALVLVRQGKYEEAERTYGQELALYKRVLGKKHPDMLTSMNNLVLVLSSQGSYEDAERIHRQALALKEKVLGKEYPSTITSMNNLASVLSSQGNYKEDEPRSSTSTKRIKNWPQRLLQNAASFIFRLRLISNRIS